MSANSCRSKSLCRKAYACDVSDDEWAFIAPYLTLLNENAPQREHSLREVFNALRWIAAQCFIALVHDLRELLRVAQGRAPQPSAAIFDGRTLQSTPESGARAGYAKSRL